jgi:hypothetical protein
LTNVLGSDDMTAKLTGGCGAAADDDEEDDDEVPVAGSASEGESSEEEEEEEDGGAEESDAVSALENAWDCKQIAAFLMALRVPVKFHSLSLQFQALTLPDSFLQRVVRMRRC